MEVHEFQSLWAIYEMEKKLARKVGRLKSFPKFSDWIPKGSINQSTDQHRSVIEGPHNSTEVVFHQHIFEIKEHLHSYLYISAQPDPTNKPTAVFQRSETQCGNCFSTDKAFSLSFGIIDKIFQHYFAQRLFVWGQLVRFYKKPMEIKGFMEI